MPGNENKMSAALFIGELKKIGKQTGKSNGDFFKGDDKENEILDVRMQELFKTAKKFVAMSLDEVAVLLDNKYYEVRMGAVCIMDFKARDKKITTKEKKALFDLYLDRHDRINNWDMVDRGAPYIVGGYLFDKPRTILKKLARSKNIWERRTAIVATYYFIRQHQVEDTFAIAELLVYDKERLINMAVGSWIREAGKQDRQRLINFLDRYAATMPRITLRYAIEKLEPRLKNKYLKASLI